MTALLVMPVLLLWAWWMTRPWHEPPARPTGAPADAGADRLVLQAPVHELRPAAVRPPLRHGSPVLPLTEDDLIEFGRQLESSDAVLGELLDSR